MTALHILRGKKISMTTLYISRSKRNSPWLHCIYREVKKNLHDYTAYTEKGIFSLFDYPASFWRIFSSSVLPYIYRAGTDFFHENPAYIEREFFFSIASLHIWEGNFFYIWLPCIYWEGNLSTFDYPACIEREFFSTFDYPAYNESWFTSPPHILRGERFTFDCSAYVTMGNWTALA